MVDPVTGDDEMHTIIPLCGCSVYLLTGTAEGLNSRCEGTAPALQRVVGSVSLKVELKAYQVLAYLDLVRFCCVVAHGAEL